MRGNTLPETSRCPNDHTADDGHTTSDGHTTADDHPTRDNHPTGDDHTTHDDHTTENRAAGNNQTRGRVRTPDRDRGQAEQLDFLNGMIILLFGVGLFFASGSVLFGIGVDSSPDRESAALHADQRLVEDLLVDDITDTELDWVCADAYFAMNESGVCSRSEGTVDTTESEEQWLRHSLGLEDELAVNVTVVEDSTITSPGGVEYALGPSPPPEVAVFESNRFVTFGDGEYYTVFVRVW